MRYVRSFLVWSRMPIVVDVDGRTYLSDQRFFGPLRARSVPSRIRTFFRKHSFLVPLDNSPPSCDVRPDLVRFNAGSRADLHRDEFAATEQPEDATLGDPEDLGDFIDRH